MNEGLRADVEELIRKLEDAQERLAPRIKEGFALGKRLRDEAKRIGEAGSDSWIGYHSRMYYGDLTAPPPPERSWDADWGWIYGIPDGWRAWSVQEIQQLVEGRAGLALRDLVAVADEVREECEPLQREALTVLSPASDLVGGDRERALLEKIDGLTWIVPPDKFVQAIAPRHMLTRDMQAMSRASRLHRISLSRRGSPRTPPRSRHAATSCSMRSRRRSRCGRSSPSPHPSLARSRAPRMPP